jgi:hypothetical protein
MNSLGALRRALVALTTVLVVGAAALAVGPLTPAGAVPCSKTWVGPTTGTSSYATPTNWSPSGMPGNTDIACITAAGTYTVQAEGSVSVEAFIVGGPSSDATLEILGDAAHGNATLTISAASSTNANGTLLIDAASAANTAELTGAGSFTNDGTITIASTGSVALTSPSTFTNAGTITNNGAFTLTSGTFDENGGATSGNPPVLYSVTLNDSGGTGSFQLAGAAKLTGTIPAGQTVTVEGSATYGSASADFLSATVTNNGTLALDSTSSNYAEILDGSLTNNGELDLNQGGGGVRYLFASVTNASTGTVHVTSTTVLQYNSTTDTNDGSWLLGDGAVMTLNSGSKFTADAGGTLGFTVDPALTASAQIQLSGGTETFAGRLLVDTVGTPALGSAFVVACCATGSFGSYEYGPFDYTPTIASSLKLTAIAPFTMTNKAVHVAQDTPVKVTLATVNDPVVAASYTATVDWGDGHQSAASFTKSGTGGTVKGAHAYDLPGSYTVATTVHASDGTTITQNAQATVSPAPVPTLTNVTPNAVGRSATATLALTGTGLTSNSVVTFVAASGIKVSSTTWKSPTTLQVKVKTASSTAIGAHDVKVTTPGGVGTCAGCLSIDAAPKPTSVAPSPVHGTMTNVTVTGTGFQAGLSVTTTIPGATLGAPASVTATSFQIQITVPGGTAPATYKLSVTNPDFGKGTTNVVVT